MGWHSDNEPLYGRNPTIGQSMLLSLFPNCFHHESTVLPCARQGLGTNFLRIASGAFIASCPNLARLDRRAMAITVQGKGKHWPALVCSCKCAVDRHRLAGSPKGYFQRLFVEWPGSVCRVCVVWRHPRLRAEAQSAAYQKDQLPAGTWRRVADDR